MGWWAVRDKTETQKKQLVVWPVESWNQSNGSERKNRIPQKFESTGLDHWETGTESDFKGPWVWFVPLLLYFEILGHFWVRGPYIFSLTGFHKCCNWACAWKSLLCLLYAVRLVVGHVLPGFLSFLVCKRRLIIIIGFSGGWENSMLITTTFECFAWEIQ